MSRHSRNLALNARVQIPQMDGETSFPHLWKVMLGGGGGGGEFSVTRRYRNT